ncbi:MAG: zinc-dependent metalloprotease [Xanthomonadales bacterium]|nr:zinc-dependent metalloprotease [Xanthomonadales bacterium]
MNAIRFSSLLLILPLLACLFGSPDALARRKAATPTPTQTGLFDLYANVDGKVILGVKALDEPFLMMTSLPSGLGSNDVGLDRGQPGEMHLVEFRRVGKKLLLVERNTRFVARSENARERASVEEAFADSVLWAGDVLDGEPLRVDFSSFLASDRHGIARQLKATQQGDYKIDGDRSVALPDASKTFPDNTELEGLLTFTGAGEGQFVRDVAMDPQAITLRQHISLVRLPEPGYTPRAYHPSSGAFSVGFTDFAQPLGDSLQVKFQPRHRLQRVDPTAERGPVVEPIIYYVDPGTPEPVRSALMEGAGWWADAFDKAGFENGFRVELLPEGADPMDVRYNVIQWVHRATRGWSYGAAITDPRNGEIIKGSVLLGSQRVRQDMLIAEALLGAFGVSDPAERHRKAEAMALARLRQLAAHEVGHTLGFAHNFAASRHGNGSVMDYPHPDFRLDGDRLDLSKAYGVGVGPWDDFLVAHGYSEFADGRAAQHLAKLRQAIRAQGYRYISDSDARATGASDPDGLLWDNGADSIARYDELMAIRQRALAGFNVNVLPPDRQLGELESRLVPIYLLHRYQLEAVARQLGGAAFDYGNVGDTTAGTRIVPADRQRAALQRLVALLGSEQLALPDAVLKLMTPPSNEYGRTREDFASNTASTFDPIAAVEAAAANTLQFLLDPARLNRVAWQRAQDAKQPGVQEVLDALIAGSWQRDAGKDSGPAAVAVQNAANWIVLDALMLVSQDAKLHSAVAASIRSALGRLERWLAANPGSGTVAASRRDAANRITRYLDDPSSIELRKLPPIPPGSPI